jgi:hypothetical protein
VKFKFDSKDLERLLRVTAHQLRARTATVSKRAGSATIQPAPRLSESAMTQNEFPIHSGFGREVERQLNQREVMAVALGNDTLNLLQREASLIMTDHGYALRRAPGHTALVLKRDL